MDQFKDIEDIYKVVYGTKHLFFHNNELDCDMDSDNEKIQQFVMELVKSINSITDINMYDDNVDILTKNMKFSTSLLIAADGKNSFVRNYNKQLSFSKQYKQSAMVLNFSHSKNHNNTAYEIFLKTGPLATLPMHKNSKYG